MRTTLCERRILILWAAGRSAASARFAQLSSAVSGVSQRTLFVQ